MKKVFIALILASCMTACSKVEDYMLGKDNTPKPAELKNITPKMDLVKKWSVPTGGKKDKAHFKKLDPVIAGNAIYTAESNGRVQAVNKQSGQIIWTNSLDKLIVSGPVISSDILALTTGDSTVKLLDANTGKSLWEKSVSNEIIAKPTIHHNKVLVKTIDGNLYAFNKNSGKQLWKMEHGAPNLILRAGSSPVVKDDMVIAGYSDGKIDAVNLNTGQLLWQRSVATIKGPSDVERLVGIEANPVIRGNTLFVAAYQGVVSALSLQNGQFIWKKPMSVYKDLSFADNHLYLTDNEDIVWALKAENGKVLWKQPALKARGLTKPSILGKKLLVGDKEGIVHVLSANNGEIISRVQLPAAVDLPAKIDNNSIYVQTANGRLNQLAVG